MRDKRKNPAKSSAKNSATPAKIDGTPKKPPGKAHGIAPEKPAVSRKIAEKVPDKVPDQIAMDSAYTLTESLPIIGLRYPHTLREIIDKLGIETVRVTRSGGRGLTPTHIQQIRHRLRPIAAD